jgi:membrane protease YdiL (CAAX protease family)
MQHPVKVSNVENVGDAGVRSDTYTSSLQGTGTRQTLTIYGGATVLLLLGTHGVIPLLSRITGQEPIVWWFIIGGLGVFGPLLLLAALLLRTEGARLSQPTWTGRLRFRAFTGGDWLWGVGALGIVGAASTGLSAFIARFSGSAGVQPSFMAFAPLTPGRYWLLALWLPFFVLNIMSEEILWRGVLLPRQEQTFGRRAWLVNGAGWLLFHLAFGWRLVILLLPVLFIEPYVVQRTRNSWVGVLVHAAFNGPAFLAIAFGWF